MLPDELPPILDLINAVDIYLNTVEEKLSPDFEQSNKYNYPEALSHKPETKRQIRFSKSSEKHRNSIEESSIKSLSIREMRLLVYQLKSQLSKLATQSLADQKLIQVQKQQIHDLIFQLSNVTSAHPEVDREMKTLKYSISRCEQKIAKLYHQVESLNSKNPIIQNNIINNHSMPSKSVNSDELKAIVNIINKEIKYVSNNLSSTDRKKIVSEVIKRLEYNENFSLRLVKALKNGCREALDQMLSNPIASFVLGFYEDWSN